MELFIAYRKTCWFRFFVCWTDCLWLVNGKAFHQPAEFLSGKRPYLGRIPWPLKFSITVQSFIKKTETILVKIQRFQGIATSPTKKIQCICIGIHLVCVPDERHQTIYAASHIRSPRYTVYLGDPGNIA